jgi:hypothetical protein
MIDGHTFFHDQFEGTAEWRRALAQDHPDDRRNLEAALILDYLAQNLDACPAEVIDAAMEVLHAEDDPNAYVELSERLRAIGFHDWPQADQRLVRRWLANFPLSEIRSCAEES